MTEEILEPVLNDKNEPFWLTRKIEKKSIGNPNRPTKEIIEDCMPLADVQIFNLKPAGMWRCKKCGAETQSLMKSPDFCPQCDRTSNFDIVTKSINTDIWKIPHWVDIDNDKKELYEELLSLVKKLLVFSSDIEYKIFVLWIMGTWKIESWGSVGFPVFIGIPNSGKSRALDIIHELGYRASKSSGVKAAAIPRLCHYHSVTLLIDECHNKLNPRTDAGSDLIDFCKDSYRRGSVYITCDNNDQEKIISTRNFGFKAFAGEKTFNPALLTRSLIFRMEKATPEISKLEYVKNELDNLHTRLLNYKLKTDFPPDLGNDFVLTGRTREIFESIISTGKHIGVPIDDVISYAKERDRKEEEELHETIYYEILTIIKEFSENPFKLSEPDRINIIEFIRELGWEDNDENRKRFGYDIKNLGLSLKRVSRNRYLFFEEKDNEDRLKQLYKRYKLIKEQTRLDAV